MKIWVWVVENKELIAGFISSIFFYITGRKTARNQEVSGELTNLKAAREVEKELFNDINITVERYQQLLEDSNDTIKKQDEIIKKYKSKIAAMKKQIINLETQILTFKNFKNEK